MLSSKRRIHTANYVMATLLVALTFGVLIYAVPVSGSALSTPMAAATGDPSLGWDFECHTNTHTSLIGLSSAAIIAELQAVNTAFQTHGYPPPQHMAYPYGDYDSRVEGVVSQYRKSARTVSDNMTTHPVTNWYELNAAQLVATTTMNDITSWVTQCISTKSLLLIFTHDVSAKPSVYGCTPTMLTKLLDYLVQQQNAGKIVVMTMAQAYDYWHNAPTQPKPTVVVSFDDANESDYLVAYPLFQARGLKGTSYIVTSYIDQQYQLRWTEIAKMRASNINYAVHLESKQNTNTTSNTGTITLNGTSYTLPTNILKTGGNYKAQYYPASGYTFDHWETTGALTVTSTTTNPTSVTVNGNGTLRAIYKTPGATNTKLAFTLSPNPAAPSQTVTLAGNLTDINNNPIYPAQVKMEYSTNGGTLWSTYTTLSTNSTGQFYKTFSTGAGTYMIRCSYAGNATYNPSSQTQTLIVQTGAKINTTIVFTLSPNPAAPGQTVTLSGTLTDVSKNPISSAQVHVSYSTNNGTTWNSWRTLTTNSSGQFSTTFSTGTGTYLLMVTYAGNSTYNAYTTGPQTLTVQ